MVTSDEVKARLRAVHGGISASDQSYRIGYGVAVGLSWLGIALAVIGLVLAVTAFCGFYFHFFDVSSSVVMAMPGLSTCLTGLFCVLFGQLARAVFDIARRPPVAG